MEFVILGLLMLGNLSQYDILKILEKKVSPFYKASLGSIQSALKKLMKLNQITLHQDEETKRKKNVYVINKEGKENFKIWMMKPINESKIDAEISTKLFFLGLLKAKDQKTIIDMTVSFLERLIDQYEESKKEYSTIHYEKKYQGIVDYQFKTLDLGIYHHKMTLKWFQNLQKELKE